MSEIVRNKGILIPYKGKVTDEIEDDPSHFDLIKITQSGEDFFYYVIFEVESEHNTEFFAEVVKNNNGSINFHTYHHNGEMCIDDVIEEALTFNQSYDYKEKFENLVDKYAALVEKYILLVDKNSPAAIKEKEMAKAQMEAFENSKDGLRGEMKNYTQAL